MTWFSISDDEPRTPPAPGADFVVSGEIFGPCFPVPLDQHLLARLAELSNNNANQRPTLSINDETLARIFGAEQGRAVVQTAPLNEIDLINETPETSFRGRLADGGLFLSTAAFASLAGIKTSGSQWVLSFDTGATITIDAPASATQELHIYDDNGEVDALTLSDANALVSAPQSDAVETVSQIGSPTPVYALNFKIASAQSV